MNNNNRTMKRMWSFDEIMEMISEIVGNYATLDTEQTFTAKKTWSTSSGGIIVNSISGINYSNYLTLRAEYDNPTCSYIQIAPTRIGDTSNIITFASYDDEKPTYFKINPKEEITTNGKFVIDHDIINGNAFITLGHSKVSEQILARGFDNQQRMAILGADDWVKGALLCLSGEDAIFNKGCVDLRAQDHKGGETQTEPRSCQVFIKPDGTFTKQGQNVLCMPLNTELTGVNGVTIQNYFCRQIDKMVFISAFITTGSSAVSAWANIITGNPKAVIASYSSAVKNGGTTKRIYITNNNTAIQASEGLEANSQYFINCAYICQ